jgi:tetratricopeptide (TPR) repeat protein
MLTGLIRQQKYRQALDEIKKVRRTDPEIRFSPSEAEIFSLQGQQEFEKQSFKHAETSFRRALDLGLKGEAHYWIARSLLAQKRLDAAFEFIKKAFDDQTLPKDYAICYLKLLLLKGETETVEALISKQSKRFSAAQMHWGRGVLALKAEQPEDALVSFEKIKRPLTPGDLPTAWVAYTRQQLGNWTVAGNLLGLRSPLSFNFLSLAPMEPKSPILKRLGLFQQAKTGEPPFTPMDMETQTDPATQEALTALATLQRVDESDYHTAAHVLLSLRRRPVHLPELQILRPNLMILAGQQALEGGEPECSETFWKPLLNEQPFNPQLAVNLLAALEQNGSEQERQRLLTRLLKWVEQEAKKNPAEWQGDRLKLTLAHLHCQIADTWIATKRYRAALGEVQQAERICPTSPEVIGRQGLIKANDEDYPEAIKLLTQALEQGCQYDQVYDALLNAWDELDDAQAKLEARRRFGKTFGDSNPEMEIQFAPWLDALYTKSYPFFSRLVQKENPDAPLRACQIFVEAVQSPPNSGGRVSLNQPQAQTAWDELLAGLSGDQQIPTLQAIALATHLFAKREKGIAAVINQYTKRLFDLSKDFPEAREAHLVVLAIKESNITKLVSPMRAYLDTMPQPGNALAQLQLQARRLGPFANLLSFIEEALQREPQNPMLLLAKATTYAPSSRNYEQVKQEGFEIARRVQDAKALHAFREEQAFLNLREAQSIMPNPERLDDMDEDDMMDVLEAMIRKMFGSKIPKAELDRMMPELKSQMLNNFPGDDFCDEEDDYDENEDDFFGGFNFFGKPQKRKTFRDL